MPDPLSPREGPDEPGTSPEDRESPSLPADPFPPGHEGFIATIHMLRSFTCAGATLAEAAALVVAIMGTQPGMTPEGTPDG